MSPQATTKARARQEVVIDAIRKLVAEHYEIPIARLNSKSRLPDTVLVRHVAMALCREVSGASYPDIAKEFAKGDHMTVMHACRRVRARYEADFPFALIYDALALRARRLAGEHV